MERKEWKPEKYNSNISEKLYSLVVKCASNVVDDPLDYACARINSLANTGAWYHFPGYGYTWIDFAAIAPGRLSGIKFNALQTLVWKIALHEENGLARQYNERCIIYPPSTSFRAEKGTYLKPGKLIQALFPAMNTDTVSEIASILALELRKLQEIDTSNIEISDCPSDIYKMTHHQSGSIGSSCMADKPSYMFNIYSDLDCKIAYLLDDDDLLIGRALLHENVTMNNENIKLMDRIYYTNNNILIQFIKYARQHGYYKKETQSLSCKNYIAPNGDIVEHPVLSIDAKNLQGRYEKVPYIDTFKYYHKQSAILCNEYSNGEEDAATTFDETNGSDDSQLFAYPSGECYHCGNNENDYELHYLESRDVHICESCLDDMYYYCDNCERYIDHGNIEAIDVGGDDEYYCCECIQEIAITCEHCDRNVDPNHIETTKDDYNLCIHCYSDHTNTCDECGEVYYHDGTVQNGICGACSEKMEEERTQEKMEEHS